VPNAGVATPPSEVNCSVLGTQRLSSDSISTRAAYLLDLWVRRRAAGAERFQFRTQEENNMIFLLE
jgi:hypothetical protein